MRRPRPSAAAGLAVSAGRLVATRGVEAHVRRDQVALQGPLLGEHAGAGVRPEARQVGEEAAGAVEVLVARAAVLGVGVDHDGEVVLVPARLHAEDERGGAPAHDLAVEPAPVGEGRRAALALDLGALDLAHLGLAGLAGRGLRAALALSLALAAPAAAVVLALTAWVALLPLAGRRSLLLVQSAAGGRLVILPLVLLLAVVGALASGSARARILVALALLVLPLVLLVVVAGIRAGPLPLAGVTRVGLPLALVALAAVVLVLVLSLALGLARVLSVGIALAALARVTGLFLATLGALSALAALASLGCLAGLLPLPLALILLAAALGRRASGRARAPAGVAPPGGRARDDARPGGPAAVAEGDGRPDPAVGQ